MATSVIDIKDMNRKAVIFNTALSAGDTLYYATMIDYIADFGGQTKAVAGTNGAQLITTRNIYLDSINSTGISKTYLFPDEWAASKTGHWTIKKGDYLLSLLPTDSYPTISYTTGLTETQFIAIKNTLHIAEIEETIYTDGEVCLRKLTMDA